MPIRYAISLDFDLVYARWSGVICPAQFFQNFEAFTQDPNYRPGRPELIDLSRVEAIDIDFSRMQRLLRIVNEQSPQARVTTKTVLWAPGDTTFGIARMYQQLADIAGGIDVTVVDTEGDALAALALPYDSIDALLQSGGFIAGHREDQVIGGHSR